MPPPLARLLTPVFDRAQTLQHFVRLQLTLRGVAAALSLMRYIAGRTPVNYKAD